jgi:hypothetical protein
MVCLPKVENDNAAIIHHNGVFDVSVPPSGLLACGLLNRLLRLSLASLSKIGSLPAWGLEL